MSWLAKIYPQDPCPVLKMYGKSKLVLEFIFMLATTEPLEKDEHHDDEWWEVYLANKYWN